jgi:hypothetical protein
MWGFDPHGATSHKNLAFGSVVVFYVKNHPRGIILSNLKYVNHLTMTPNLRARTWQKTTTATTTTTTTLLNSLFPG